MKILKLIITIIILIIVIKIFQGITNETIIKKQANNTTINTLDNELIEWPDSIYNIVRSASYLSDIEKDVIIEHNKCRTNPSRYATEVLVPFRNSINSNGQYQNSKGQRISTHEGRKSVDEAINALYNQKPLPMLRPKEYLHKAAKDHCLDQGPKGLYGHTGTDGSTPSIRVKKYIHEGYCGVGENISYGQVSGKEIFIQLIVDDGVKNRGHRENILKEYRFIGCAFGYHKKYNCMCPVDYEL